MYREISQNLKYLGENVTKNKLQGDATTYLLKWLKINNNKWQYEMMMRMWNNTYTLLIGIKNGIATLENSLTISYKVKHEFTI